MLSTLVIGGMFVPSSWLEVIESKRSADGSSKIPTALYPSSMLVAWDLIAFIYLDSDAVMQLHVWRVVIWLSVLTISLCFLASTRFLVRRNSGPGTRMVSLGSKILVMISIPCVLLMILGLPGLLQRR